MLLPEVSITLDTNQQPAAVIRDALSSARLVPRLALHLGLREAEVHSSPRTKGSRHKGLQDLPKVLPPLP